MKSPQISVVIPLFNEEESLAELHSWIVKTMQEHTFTYEVLFIDDGSRDKSWEVIESLQQKDPCVFGVKFQRNYGKSAALYVGFARAKGEVVVTMDADLQDSPDEIPEMRKMIVEDGYDLISGWKKKRYDPISKTLPTKLFNAATRMVTGISLHDFNCGLKAYRKNVIKSVEVYGEMHRYIPVLAKQAGFLKIGEKVVEHQARKYGKSKFGLERFLNGFLDLLSITFMSRFGKRPMHIFGAFGLLMFFFSFCFMIWMGADKLIKLNQGEKSMLIADRPEFYISLCTTLVGIMLFLAGFLGELITRNSAGRNEYAIEIDGSDGVVA